MKLHFYGTGASEGFPSLFCECEYCKKARITRGKDIRTRASCQVDDHLLIDFSPDTYAHELYGGLDLTKIRDLLVTHSHPDHFYASDIGGILPPMAKVADGRTLGIYGNKRIEQIVNETLAGFDGWEKRISLQSVNAFEAFEIGEYYIVPLKADHMKEEECLLYIIEREGKTLLYGHDSAMFPEDTWKAMSGYSFDCVVMDCTSVDKDRYFPSHMGISDNIRIKSRMIREGMASGQTRFIATHFAHSFAPFHERLTELFQSDGIIPAYDGMEIIF